MQLYGNSDDAGDVETGPEEDTPTCKRDVMFAGVSQFAEASNGSHLQCPGTPVAGDSNVNEVETGRSEKREQRGLSGRAFRSVDSHNTRRNLQTPMSVCDLSTVKIDVETTTTVDYCSGEPLRRWQDQQERAMQRDS